MDFAQTPKSLEFAERLQEFMAANIYPNETRYHDEINAGDRWQPIELIEELKSKAKAAGLWNLFLPDVSGLSNLEYAPLAEIMGRVTWAAEVFNCSAPDTGNMEVLHLYGTEEQKRQWLEPLLAGEIRSCFAMTEPDVASSDATNIRASIKADDDDYVLNGRKWWSTGAGDARCKLAIFMGKTDESAPKHLQQSMVLVPMDADGVKVERILNVFGFDDAPNGHVEIRRRPRVRDSTGKARAGPSASLHAADRPGGTLIGNDVSPGEVARRVREACRGSGRHPPMDRRSPHRHRPGSSARPARRLENGHRREQSCPQRDRDDKGCCSANGTEDR
jgi:hypothetical protein